MPTTDFTGTRSAFLQKGKRQFEQKVTKVRKGFLDWTAGECTKSVTGVVALLRILAGCAKRRGRIPAVVFDR